MGADLLPSGLDVAGAFVLTHALNAAALLGALAALGAAAGRARAVIRGDSEREIRRARARGMLGALIVGRRIILVDVLIEIYARL